MRRRMGLPWTERGYPRAPGVADMESIFLAKHLGALAISLLN